MTRNRQWSDLGSDKNWRSPGLTTTPLFITTAAPWGCWPLEWIPCVQESTTQRASEPAGVISAELRMGEAGGGGGGGGGGVSRRGGGSSSEAAVSDPTLGRGWRWALPLSHSWEPTKISGSEVSWYLKEGEDGDMFAVKLRLSSLWGEQYTQEWPTTKSGKNWLQIKKKVNNSCCYSGYLDEGGVAMWKWNLQE